MTYLATLNCFSNKLYHKDNDIQLDVVVYTINLSTWEVEACGNLRVQGQPSPYNEFLDT